MQALTSPAMQPRFSIVVPTRERANTLWYTLKSVLSQDYDNCEIIVSDNCSGDETHNVVKSFTDRRLKYLRTEKRLSMSRNWEFALNHCSGEFVTFLGDDDALMPDALAKADKLLKYCRADALVWRKADYQWPSYPLPALQNTAFVYLPTDTIKKLSGKAVLDAVINFRDTYAKLPCVYNSLVRLERIKEIQLKSKQQIFFNSISPDVYSGIALTVNIKEYCYTTYPLSLNGASINSNGTAAMVAEANEHSNEAEKNRKEESETYDEKILIGPSPSICVVGEYLRVRENITEMRTMWGEPNFKRYVRRLIYESESSLKKAEIIKSAHYTCEKTGTSCHESLKTIMTRVLRTKLRTSLYEHFLSGVTQERLAFALPEFVSDVYSASMVISGLMPGEPPTKVRSSTASCIHQIATRARQSLSMALKDIYRGINKT